MAEKVAQLNRERTIFWSLVGVLFLCAGFYMYFINSTIQNVVARQNFENESSKLALTIGSNEFKYISLRNAINLDMAYSLGFKDISAKTFITKKSVSVISYLPR